MAITLITCLYMLIQAIYVTSVGILSIRIRALPDAFSEIDDMTPLLNRNIKHITLIISNTTTGTL